MLMKNRMVFDAIPDGGGAGGGAPTATPTAPSPGTPPPAPAAPQGDWRTSLPDDLKNEPSLKLINDVSGLAKSYVSAQKLVGADKIPVPSKHATEEDWKNVYHKLGLPQDVKDYDVKVKEGISIDKEFNDRFKSTAHKAGILPKQAQALADWFGEENSKAETTVLAEFKKDQDLRMNALKEKWGAAADERIQGAKQLISELASPELVKYLNDSGLGGEPRVVEIFAELHNKYMKEAGEKGGRPNAEPVMTPKEAQSEINTVMSQVSTHPYFIKDHPNHKAAVAEMQHLYKMANPAKSAVDKTM